MAHKELAAQKGVALLTLQFWLYKLRRESRQESQPVLLPVEVVPSAALPARAAETVSAPGVVEAVLPSGAVLRFAFDADVDTSGNCSRRSAEVLLLPSAVRIHLALGGTDMRNSIGGLFALVCVRRSIVIAGITATIIWISPS